MSEIDLDDTLFEVPHRIVPSLSTSIYILSAEEEAKILSTWNSGKINLKEIIEEVFGQGFDGRSKQGIATKKFLGSRNLKAAPAHIYQKKTDKLELTEAQKEFIANNANSMRPLEMSRILFKNSKLEILSTEARLVTIYYNSLDKSVRMITEDAIEEKEYRPPKTEDQAVARVNKYIMDGLDGKNLTSRQKDDMKRFIRVMHNHRVQMELNRATKVKDRELFESSFVRYVWDKPDLTEEEIDAYLNLCNDIISAQRIQDQLKALVQAHDDDLETNGKPSMSIVESINGLHDEMHKNSTRQKSAFESLNGKRAKRMEARLQENASILNLVEAFKDSYKREALLKLIESRKKKISSEVERLSSLDGFKFEIFGIGKQEAL